MRWAARPDLAGVDEVTVADAAFETEEAGFGGGDQFGGAQRVALPAFEAGDDDGAPSVVEGEVAGR